VRHETTEKGNNGTRISQNARVETARNGSCGTVLQGWKMRDMNIRERQSIESRWLLNTGKRGQRLACLLMSDTLEYHFFSSYLMFASQQT